MNTVPPVINEPPRKARVLVVVGMGAGVLGAAILFFFDPAQHGFFPRCFFRLMTGWDCPGCGGLRATHQLLHGHLREAFTLNPLFVVALPLVACVAARPFVEKFADRKLVWPFNGTAWLWVTAVIVIAFGVLRNLPWQRWLGA